VLSHLDDLEGVLREDYRQAIKARVLLARAHAYRRLAHIDIAREHYETAQALLPKDPTIRFNLGLLDALSGNLEKAISEVNLALGNAPKSLRDEMLQSLDDKAFHEIRARLKND
jgi:Flp pilus assembly protein TadD